MDQLSSILELLTTDSVLIWLVCLLTLLTDSRPQPQGLEHRHSLSGVSLIDHISPLYQVQHSCHFHHPTIHQKVQERPCTVYALDKYKTHHKDINLKPRPHEGFENPDLRQLKIGILLFSLVYNIPVIFILSIEQKFPIFNCHWPNRDFL